MSILTHSTAFVLYDGEDVSNNPSEQFGNWKRTSYNITVSKPQGPSQSFLAPGSTSTIFSGVRSVTLDGTSVFSMLANNVSSGVYRMQWASGTFGGFRTKRSVDYTSTNVTIAGNNNAVATFTGSVALTGVVVGDIVFIGTSLTGDSALNSPFNLANGGYWVIIGISGTNFTATRLPGQSFSFANETVSVTAATQLVIFSNSGVQVGDTLVINAGFSTVSQKSFIVSNLSWNWVEFSSATPIPLENTITVGSAGFTVYSSAKRWVRIECDQEVVLRFNGDTGDHLKLELGPDNVGWFDSFGLFYSLDVVNKSQTAQAILTISTVE